jgi:hypothetical protein
MAMLNLFHWVNNYFSDVFADDLTFNPEILVPVIMEGLVLTIIVWTYHRLFNSSQMRLSRNWFDKKSYLLIFRLLFYFQLFLALLIVVEILIHILQPFTHLTTLNAALVSCAFALLATMIPAIIYFSKSTRVEKPKHIHHHHHHRHGRSSQQKNPESTPEPTQSQ